MCVLCFVELICAGVFNSCMISYYWNWEIQYMSRPSINAILEIGWHKSPELESNLIKEFIEPIMQS